MQNRRFSFFSFNLVHSEFERMSGSDGLMSVSFYLTHFLFADFQVFSRDEDPRFVSLPTLGGYDAFLSALLSGYSCVMMDCQNFFMCYVC